MRLFLFLLGMTPAMLVATEKPNVIFFMADDMGMGDTSAYQDFTGNADDVQIATPSMERLAAMGMRFTDAHTPASRCSPTRYGLMTGRYPWRNRLKYWVLFGVQGDPMIERDRPTLGTLFQDNGYATGMFGKWHVGLRYRNSEGKPADGWEDADLTQPMFDTPADHGFDVVKFTSRSHGTSGPSLKGKSKNGPTQNRGPGHIDGRKIVGATGNGKELVSEGLDVYDLNELGGRHSDNAMAFLKESVAKSKPFFLYYPSNSNHGPYTPDSEIGGVPVAGAAKNKAGVLMNVRSDYIYENDVALGRLLDFLEAEDDPRNHGKKLIANTIVVFTSDNGAEIKAKFATGPFRSHKGSCYEGGHRVPFLVSWPDGGIPAGKTNDSLIGLIDMFATLSEVTESKMPDLSAGKKGGEDSGSVLAAWKGQTIAGRPQFYSDHNEAKKTDPAVLAFRLDDENGKWKGFFDAALVRHGKVNVMELYDLATDSKEENNRVSDPKLAELISKIKAAALHHRNSGGHRMTAISGDEREEIRFDGETGLTTKFSGISKSEFNRGGVTVTIESSTGKNFSPNERGLGIEGGTFNQVDDGEAILISFDQDVIVDSVGITAGIGLCGGFYRVGEKGAPLAIYCTDADIDEKDQSGVLSDIGVLKKGTVLRLDSSPHYGVEVGGKWRLSSLAFRRVVK